MLTKHNVMGVCEYLANLLVSGPIHCKDKMPNI